MNTPTLLLLAILLCAPFAASAAPPENADPALAPWFQSLRQPETGMSCCDIADCRPTDVRTVEDHYEVLINGIWMPVPARRILQRGDNPTGRAVVCWTPQRGIMCFIRGTET